MYKVGDKVVYPVHGVGTVEAIEKKAVLGQKDDYYTILIVSNGMKVMIPVKNCDSVGIRPVIAKSQTKKVLDLLKNGETRTEDDWKLRYEINANKVKTGDILEVAEVARDIFRRGRDKELSTMERKLYESAYNLIIHELAMAKDVDIEVAGNVVSEALSAS
jgi:CarD family transcriptional regulator